MISNNDLATSAGAAANTDVDNLSHNMSQLMSGQNATTSTGHTDTEGVTGGSQDAADSNDANNGTPINNGAIATNGADAQDGAGAQNGAGTNTVAAVVNAPAPVAAMVINNQARHHIVPYLGLNNQFNMDTPPDQFPDWMSYITFCQVGPTIKVEFAVLFNSAGRAVGFNQMLVSKKLLKDHSEYFKTMLTGPMWKENRDQCVVYDDISMAQFNRLYQFILAGAPAPRISLGRAEHAMRNLLDVYLLADRFGMPVVLDWINESIADAMAVATNWRKMYTQTVLDGRGGLAAITFHDLKAMDWANFYLDVKTLPGHLRPVRLMDILNWIIDNAPGEVIQNVWPNFPGDFQRDLALAYVTKYMATRV